MAEREVHGRPDGHVRKQNHSTTDLDSAPDILHQKWLECKQYSVTTAKQSPFKEAVHLAQETAAAKEGGESQVKLFAMLQEQHDKQIAVMAAIKKANMDAMIEKMNALVVGGGNRRMTQQDKEITPPGGNRRPPAGTDQTKKPKKQKALCPHCKPFALHKPDNCYELEANKDTQWPGWKSVHATM